MDLKYRLYLQYFIAASTGTKIDPMSLNNLSTNDLKVAAFGVWDALVEERISNESKFIREFEEWESDGDDEWED